MGLISGPGEGLFGVEVFSVGWRVVFGVLEQEGLRGTLKYS